MSGNTKIILLARLIAATFLMLALSLIALPRTIDEIRYCEDEPLALTVGQLAADGLPDNRFLELYRAWVNVDDPNEILHSESARATYVKLRLPNTSEAVYPLLARLSGELTSREIQLIFATEYVLAYVREPATPRLSSKFQEQLELTSWLGEEYGSPIVVELLDAPPLRWRSPLFWGALLGLALIGGAGLSPWFQTRIFQVHQTLIAGACGLLALGSIAWMAAQDPTGPWEPLPVALAAVVGMLGLVTLVLSICRGATLAFMTSGHSSAESDRESDGQGNSPFRLTDDGFQIHDGAEVFQFKDADVIGFAVLLDNRATDDGILCRRAVRLRLRQGNTSELLRIDDVVEAGSDDPMHNYLRRLTGQLTSRFEQELAGGGEVQGCHWTLNRAELTLRSKQTSRTVELESIASVDWVHNAFCIWLHGEEYPCGRLPADSENVHVLATILPKLMGPRCEVQGEHGLGRQLLTVRPQAGWARKAQQALSGQTSEQEIRELTLFDTGVLLETDQSKLKLELNEITGLSRETDKKVVSLRIWHADHPVPFRLSVSCKENTDLELLRCCEEVLAQSLSKLMLRKLVAHGQVAWTPEIQLTLQGLEVRNPDGTSRTISLSETCEIRQENESVVVECDSESEPNVEIAVSERNALVGMFALKDLRSVYSDTCVGFRLPPRESTTT